jgi:ATP-dependent Clp protease ATP-binding subunit ClpC
LDLEAIKRIIDVELKGLVKRIKDLGYEMQLTDAAKVFVATKGYDVQFGARPLKRAIQNYIEDGISELIVNGDLPLGSVIHITKEGDELKINV